MNNLSSYCGLVDAKIRASDKYLPVPSKIISTHCALAQNNHYAAHSAPRVMYLLEKPILVTQ